ncbi:MAG: VOC family protein [bacterium]|nr:VOC family protein [bacterium]MDP3963768.1 VOC family protein [bacterium]
MQIKELGHVVLYVTDLARMADFYRNTLGFRQIARDGGFAVFSSGRTHHELLLIEVGGNPVPKKHLAPGLYHIGFKIGDSTEDVKKALKELEAAGVTIIGTADHGVTHSLYVLDPDGNELELYADVSDAWKDDPAAIMSPTKPLEL